jgi:hypothetical protein
LQGRGDIGMSHQLLLDFDIRSQFAKHARERVPEVVPSDSVLAGRLEAGGTDPFRLNVRRPPGFPPCRILKQPVLGETLGAMRLYSSSRVARSGSRGIRLSDPGVFTCPTVPSTTARRICTSHFFQLISPHCSPKISETLRPRQMAITTIVRKGSGNIFGHYAISRLPSSLLRNLESLAKVTSATQLRCLCQRISP